MAQYLYPAGCVLLAWWISTGVIFVLDGLPRRTFRWTMLGATVLLAAALYGLAAGAGDATPRGAYVAFACGLAIWGWQEVAFLTGFITGPDKAECPAGVAGWRRFVLASRAVLWHELAIAAMAVAVVALTWGEANQVGTWTYLLLWVMRLSAKLNVFLGVRNLGEGLLPDHLRYLQSFFRCRPMNRLFPLSVAAASAIAALLFRAALAAEDDSFEVAAFMLVGTLTALAVAEHCFMILPVSLDALWTWSRSLRGPGLRGPGHRPATPAPAAPDTPVHAAPASLPARP